VIKQKILVVDDNDVTRQCSVFSVEAEGAEATQVGNGFAALAAIRRNTYALILMDFEMPVMNGLQCTQRIRAFEWSSGRPRTPIVGYTSSIDQTIRDLCMQSGMDDYLTKPANAENFRSAIHKWLL